MSKKLHVNAYPMAYEYVEGFLVFVEQYNNPSTYEEFQAENYEPRKPLVEILYQEQGRASRPNTSFDLWFATPATGFYFGLGWAERLRELERWHQEQQAHAAQAATYPQFFHYARLGYFLRYNAPDYFCLVGQEQLQVRRERPQELFKPEEVQPITEAQFLQAYYDTRQRLQDWVQRRAVSYQRRGSAGNEWFYANAPGPEGANFSVPPHLRLNVTANEYGQSWQLLLDLDRNRGDLRRVSSSREEFTRQFDLALAELAQAATGQLLPPA